jgi:hypothetical protein
MTQLQVKPEQLVQATDYLRQAQFLLGQSHIIDNIVFADVRVTRDACAMACLAVLKAIDAYMIHRGVQQLPMTIDDYRVAVETMPIRRRIQPRLTVVYQNLHMLGYMSGGVDVEMIKSGFRRAHEILQLIDLYFAPIGKS